MGIELILFTFPFGVFYFDTLRSDAGIYIVIFFITLFGL